MALRDAWNALTRKDSKNEIAKKDKTASAIANLDLFPVVELPESEMEQYQKVPLAGIAALGAAFSQLPEAARTIVQQTTTQIRPGTTYFTALNPKGVSGYLLDKGLGTSGNIFRINEQGKQVIAGRLFFQPTDVLPGIQTTATTLRVDPTLFVIAACVIAIQQEFADLHAHIEKVLQVIEQTKQARQRGNLHILTDVMEGYKLKCNDEKWCAVRSNSVLEIARDAMTSINDYQTSIEKLLTTQQDFHDSKKVQSLVNQLSHHFAEYQLACYLYAFSAYLDALLLKSFDTQSIDSVTTKIDAISQRYHAFYTQARTKLADYQRSSVGMKLKGGVAIGAKKLGQVIHDTPILEKGPVDEALVRLGNSLGNQNRESLQELLSRLEAFSNCRVAAFVDNLHIVHALYEGDKPLLTDGNTLYIPKSA